MAERPYPEGPADRRGMSMSSVGSPTDLQSVAAYARRIGAEARSLRKLVVREQVNERYYRDTATIELAKDGSVRVMLGYGVTEEELEALQPTAAEADAIKSECSAAQWPTSVTLTKHDKSRPDKLKGVDPETLFELRDRSGN